MPKTPRIRGREAVRAFERVGFIHTRTKGSHFILKKDGHPHVLSVPVHQGKTIKPPLLDALIDAAGLTMDEFIELL